MLDKVFVCSETGKLRKVLLHRPGRELEHLIPQYMDRLLFDDIPFLQRAAEEHDAFSKALTENGVQVVYLIDLVSEVLDKYNLREQFISEFIRNAGFNDKFVNNALLRYLSAITDSADLVRKTMEGISYNDIELKKKNSLFSMVNGKEWFATDPIPNLYFTRDPMAVLGDGIISLNSMFYATRIRESLYVKYATLMNRDLNLNTKFVYLPSYPYTVEGGDLMVLSDEVLAVGLSQRTEAPAVDLIAESLFEESDDGRSSSFKHIVAIDIPSMRAFMHLDTVLTQADNGVFLVHPQVVSNMKFYVLSKEGGKKIKISQCNRSLEYVLEKYLNLDSVKLIQCGGNSPIASAREQWNDGSNVFCIEPGKVVVYDRNTITNRILEDNGLKTIPIPSSELSRGRGGPRCMAMPLLRD